MSTSTAQVETYRKLADIPPRSRDGNAASDVRSDYARAGLTELISVAPKHADSKTRFDDASVLYSPLSEDDAASWRRYLPTSYQLSTYTYDVPPREVVQAIGDARELMLFNRIEIWTSEGSSIGERVGRFYRRAARRAHDMFEIAADPMAVGVITLGSVDHYFPIVRWGEALHSFTRIKATVRLRSAMVFALTKLPFILLGLAVLGVLVWAIAATWWAVGAWAILWWALGAFVLAMLTVPIWAEL